MSHLYLLRVDIIASTSLDRDDGHGIVLPNIYTVGMMYIPCSVAMYL